MRCKRIALFAALPALTAAGLLSASAPRPASRPSVEVHPDRSVTFRILAPQAREVTLGGEAAEGRPQLANGGAGWWSLTLPPLAPDLYGYYFFVDGVRTLDPRNFRTRRLRPSAESVVEVAGDSPQLFQVQDVPHGVTHRHDYLSRVLREVRPLLVHTPPGYEAEPAARYPVLYLLHGAGEDVEGWVANGPSGVIADNLVALGRAVPMIVVTPLGQVGGNYLAASPEERARHLELFERELLEEIVPFVESRYRIEPGREGRAIAGLSMGGAQALRIGLARRDRFAWVGAFGAALGRELSPESCAARLGEPAAGGALRLLWLGCGRDDGLFPANRALHDVLQAQGIAHVFVERSGAHTWLNWRACLIEFLPLLFRSFPMPIPSVQDLPPTGPAGGSPSSRQG